MGFFRRDNRDPSAQRQPADGQIPDDELDVAIDDLEQMVVESMSEAPISRDMLELLQVGLPYLIQRECSNEAVVVGQTAARLGYLSRAAEFAMFDGELGSDDDLVQALSESFEQADSDGSSASDAMADLAAAIASDESLDPSPQEGGPTWTLPGLTGQARGRLRDSLLSRMERPSDILADDLKRTWKYGYFLRALDELCDD